MASGTQRVRRLTEKDENMFQANVDDFTNKLSNQTKKIDSLFLEFTSSSKEQHVIQPLREQLLEVWESYLVIARQFTEYLARIRSVDSERELSAHTFVYNSVEARVDLLLKEMDKFMNTTQLSKEQGTDQARLSQTPAKIDTTCSPSAHRVRSPSQASSISGRSLASSKMSNVSSVLLRQKAKHEAAKVRLQFTKKEAEIVRQRAEQEAIHRKCQADMDMSLKLLQSERDLVEAEAELRAIDDSLAFEDIEGFPVGTASCDLERVVAAPPHTTGHQCIPNVSSGLNPEAPAFNQKPTQPDGGVSELTNYIMKKDLLLSRLSKYDDRPERYLVWKTSFRNIARELKVNATEELDLLGRWLGEESSRQATSLRTANCHNEAQALSRIWSRLDERYGSPELVEAALRQRLDSVSKLSAKDRAKLYELSDLLAEIEAVKGYERYQNSFSYFDSPHGVNQVLQKLPAFMQNKWIDLASRFKREHAVMYPPFTIFVDFVRNMATRCNDPSFKFESNLVGSTKAPTSSSNLGNMKKSNNNVNGSRNQVMVSARKTDITPDYCPLHDKEVKHILKDCRLFQSKSMSDKKDVIKKFGICFKCCKGKHLSKDCKDNIKCERCGSSSHCTTFHIDRGSPEKHGGEQTHQDQGTTVSSKCTQICGSTSFPGKSCGKTVLVKVYPKGRPEEALDMYAIIDDQSNRSLVRSEFFEHFNDKSESIDYVLSSFGGQMTKCGRRASGYVIESTDGTYRSALPELIECNEIPNSKHEIPTPAVAKAYKHLKGIETFIPNSDAPILLLIGRDLIAAHHVLEQRIASGNTPYAQKLRLGWVIIGETCLGAAHQPDLVTVNKTTVLRSGRASYFKPCPYNFEVNYASISDDINLHGNVFRHTKDDEVLGLSQEDKEFIHQMEEEFYKTPEGNWSAPLPLRQHRPRLENNRDQVFKRTENLVKSLQRNPVKQRQFCDFMQGMFDKQHAELAPPLESGEECRYLPIFPVYHPKKPGKIRVVFDSSAKYNGYSLNDVLLTGPDVTNSLVGVLLKFRKEKVAITADVEQMFFNFNVHRQYRNLLRFIWFKDNDPTKDLIDYRMRVHVFGNSPSPAVATIGLRKSACNHADQSLCDEVCDFVKNHFYVDDGLISSVDAQSAVNLMKKTQRRLKQEGNLNLHKISSNNADVLSSFSPEDLAKDLSAMDFDTSTANVQRSLGLYWEVKSDTFQYKVCCEEKPSTKRGILSTVNSVFDPLGFVAPVLLGGRLILRNIIQTGKIDWDEPIPDHIESEWTSWRKSLKDLQGLAIPRTYSDIGILEGTWKELHIFSDASKEAIGAVAYLRIYDMNESSRIGFILGKSKVAPMHGHTIPRLELCAAVLATDLADFILKHLDATMDSVSFYTDSKVVLGYLTNKTRRFYVYVGNRVDRILRSSSSTQWSYVPTDLNPADCATRPLNSGSC